MDFVLGSSSYCAAGLVARWDRNDFVANTSGSYIIASIQQGSGLSIYEVKDGVSTLLRNGAVNYLSNTTYPCTLALYGGSVRFSTPLYSADTNTSILSGTRHGMMLAKQWPGTASTLDNFRVETL